MKLNKMKIYLTFILLVFIQSSILAQEASDYFNRAANEYIYKNEQVALNTLGVGLSKYPNDEKLKKLKEKLEKEKEEKDQEQDKDNQNQDDQENEKQEEQQNKEEQEKDKEKQEQQENQDQEPEDEKNADEKEQSQQPQEEETDEEGKEMDEPPQTRKDKLEELNLTEEKAQMILEAMKNNEIQYIQQNTRKATKKQDSNKPDW